MLLPILTCWLALGAGAAPTVSVDLRPLPEHAYRELDGLGLERKIALRLVQDGFAVVSVDQPQVDIRIEITGGVRSWEVHARHAGTHLTRRVVSGPRFSSLAQIHLELSQKASELARGLRPSLAAAISSEVVSSSPTPSPTAGTLPPASSGLAPQQPEDAVPQPPPAATSGEARDVTRPITLAPARPSHSFELGLLGSVLVRAGGTQGLGLLVLRGRWGHFGFTLELAGTASQVPALSVLELSAAAGPTWFFLDSERWEGALSLEAGALFQSAHLSDAYASDPNDRRALVAGWVPVFVALRVTPFFSVGVRAAAGLTQGVEHESEGQTLWSRGGLRGEAGLGVQGRFE